VLEIASGTGEHAVHFARHLPGLTWQPSDAGPLDSIAAWQAWADLPNLFPPLHLDVTARPWPLDGADALFCANLLHVAPWRVCQELFAGAAHLLPARAPLVIYGPFFRDNTSAAPSNLAFDADLRARDPQWGIRRLEAVERAADQHGFTLEQRQEVPANNLTLVFRRQPE
jgi:hypothetical protein